MPQALNILLLEDEPVDAALIKKVLEEQFPESRVEYTRNRDDYLRRLTAGGYDLVLSDCSVLGCEGLKAFYLARERQPEIPFIYISGFKDSDRDMLGLQSLGVSDFLNKSDYSKLGAAIKHALKERKREPVADPRLIKNYEYLVEVIRQLSLAYTMPSITAIVRRAVRELTGADGATFVLREGELSHYVDEDAIGPLWKGQKFPMEACISGWVMINRQPAVVKDIYKDPRIPLSVYEPTFVRSVVMVPIRPMEPIGAIGAYWAQEHIPEPGEVRMLQMLADTTAVAMENVRIITRLEERVRERTAELEAFTYIVSHDLRTPLRHIDFFAQTMLKECQAGAITDPVEMLSGISSAVKNMQEMIDALLDLSRTARAPVRRETLDLAVMARNIAQEMDKAYERQVDFSAPAALMVSGDAVLLRSAITNLLGNAWKFTGKCTKPRVELGVEYPPNGQTVYYVKDNGAGFNDLAAKKLFGVFQRMHSQSEFPGTGVGLASVQRIIRKHGGDIWARARKGEGATFYFTLGESDAS